MNERAARASARQPHMPGSRPECDVPPKVQAWSDPLVYPLFTTSSGKVLFKLLDLRHVPVHDVGIVGIIVEEFLVIVLGRVEGLKGHDLRHDRPRENLRRIQRADVAFRNLLLPVVRIEDDGAVLCPMVGALEVQLRGSCATEKKTFSRVP